MKNIIIAGIPMAGKSTLAKMLMKELKNFDYSYIEGDIIDSAFLKFYIEKLCNLNEFTNLDVCIERNYVKNFVLNLLSAYNSTICSHNIIYDTAFLSIKSLCKLKNNGYMVIVLGCPQLNEKTFYENVKKSENSSNRSSNQDDDILRDEIKEYVAVSASLKKECKRADIKFFDTSFNRNDILNEACEYIINHIKN